MKARLRLISALVSSGALLTACGAESEPADSLPATPLSGMYEVRGQTITESTGDKRQISGRIIIAEDEAGGSYTATFTLNTTYPGAEEALPAEVIGKGEGTIEGRTLKGSAQTQLVMATVPGVDPGFSFMPRRVSTRIVSRSLATIAADGTVQVEISSQAAPGQEYLQTRTTLYGQRLSSDDAGRVATGPAQ